MTTLLPPAHSVPILKVGIATSETSQQLVFSCDDPSLKDPCFGDGSKATMLGEIGRSEAEGRGITPKRSSICPSLCSEEEPFDEEHDSSLLFENYRPLTGSFALLKGKSHGWGGRTENDPADGVLESEPDEQQGEKFVRNAPHVLSQDQQHIQEQFVFHSKPAFLEHDLAESPSHPTQPAPPRLPSRRRVIFPMLHNGSTAKADKPDRSQKPQDSGEAHFRPLERGVSLPRLRADATGKDGSDSAPLANMFHQAFSPLPPTKSKHVRHRSDEELLEALDVPKGRHKREISAEALKIPPFGGGGQGDNAGEDVLRQLAALNREAVSRKLAALNRESWGIRSTTELPAGGTAPPGQTSCSSNPLATSLVQGQESNCTHQVRIPTGTESEVRRSLLRMRQSSGSPSGPASAGKDENVQHESVAPKVSPLLRGNGKMPVPKTYYPPSNVPRYFQVDSEQCKAIRSKAKPLPSILRSRSMPVSVPDTEKSAVVAGPVSGKNVPNDDEVPQAPPLARLSSVLSEDGNEGKHSSLEEQLGNVDFFSPKLQPLPAVSVSAELEVMNSASIDDASSSSGSSMRKIHSETCLVNHKEEGRRKSVKKVEEEDLGSIRHQLTRHSSMEDRRCKTINFDPRIWVFEYERAGDEADNWFTMAELERFKFEAIARIQRRQTHLISSGTGRVIAAGAKRRGTVGMHALFTDPALGIDADDNNERGVTCSPSPDDKMVRKTLRKEIRNVLVIDPHDLFLKLFTKSIRAMMGHVIITTARNAVEAQRRISAAQVVFPQSDGGATHGFDIIICEERLNMYHGNQSLASKGGHQNNAKREAQAAGDDQNQCGPPPSGSALLSEIASEQQEIERTWRSSPWWVASEPHPRFSLLVGVSAHIVQDKGRLATSGADFVWGKPPPSMDARLRNCLLKAILEKRGKPTAEIFE